MVRERKMGLLDDAIREHLEIKRLRGADPDELAREEQEALGPVHRGQDLSHEEAEIRAEDGSSQGEGHIASTAGSPPRSGLHQGGQETAELDMNSVLDAEEPSSKSSAGDSLEWEVPGQAPIGTQEQERESDSRVASAGTVEDVLEETPDFLRETPDQERLWFEQQPPRDFDFDK
jgi:hypothetical protein